MGHSVKDIGEIDEFQHRSNFLVDLRFFPTLHLQAKTDILGHGLVGEKGVVLKHHVGFSIAGTLVSHGFSHQIDLTGSGLLEPTHHPENGRLSAPAWSQKGQKHARWNREGYIIDGDNLTESLCYVPELDTDLFHGPTFYG
jgi:hypothetical protein